jgi:hypothetical protein
MSTVLGTLLPADAVVYVTVVLLTVMLYVVA